jgi:cyclic pyranopterin phosphate synthase
VVALCEYAWARGFVPRFIEQMPMAGGALFVPGTLLAAAEIRARVEQAHGRLVADGLRRGAGPARYFRVEGSARVVGIVSAMTEHFCDTCNRVRLSSAGALHACLAYDDAVDLRGALRQGGEQGVIAAIRAAVGAKRDGHSFQLVGIGGPRKTMIAIGG